MSKSNGHIANAIIGGVFLIGACIVLAGAIVADAVARTAADVDSGSLEMTAMLVATLFFVLGVGGLYKTSKALKEQAD